MSQVLAWFFYFYAYKKNIKLLCGLNSVSLWVLVFGACTPAAVYIPGPFYSELQRQLAAHFFPGGRSSCLHLTVAGFLAQLHAHVFRENI